MPLLDAWRFQPRLAACVWLREVDVYRKIYRSTILGGLADPIIYLLALGFGLGAYVQLQGPGLEGLRYVEFIAPGLVASSAMMAATFEVSWNSYMRLHHEQVYAAMLTTPANAEDIVAGELLWAATRSLLYAVVMMAVLLAFGVVRSPLAVLVPPAAALGGLLFAVLGLSYTALVRHMDQLVFWFTLFITPMFLLGGVFFPVEGLPAAVQLLAQALPLTHLVAVVRALVLGTASPGTLLHLGYLAALLAIAWPLPLALLRRKLVR
jgi:lipooligosaccharide transport system permease protein